jgi:hypothetical protein
VAVAGYLREHAEPARSWPQLRQWIRGLKTCGSPAVFARVAFAAAPGECDLERLHPAMMAMARAVKSWLDAPSPESRQAVRDAIAARNRTFVPLDQVCFAVQHAADAAVTDSLDQASDRALHAVVKAAPEIADGSAPEVEETCRDLQRRIRAALE